MGGTGDLSMGFGAGATSIGEGGGATMEGMPSLMGGPMQMPGGGMAGPATAMQGMEGGPMPMPMGGAGSPSEGGLMSKQFIEGGEGGMFYSILSRDDDRGRVFWIHIYEPLP